MQRISLSMHPVNRPFEVPFSTGYQTYSGILSVLDSLDHGLADDLHDVPHTTLCNSGLLGWFGSNADRDYHKVVQTGEEGYDLHLGVTHPDDRDVFEALIRAFVMEDRNLPLAHGELTVDTVSTERTTPQKLLEKAATAAEDARGVRMNFLSTTCRERYENVWESHPDRIRLFQHLSDRWNASTDDAIQLAPTVDSLGQELFTKVDATEYRTNSIVVYRREPGSDSDGVDEPSVAADGGHLNEVQGFTGTWEYHFKDSSEATQTAVVALAMFAQYAGVGRHNARGAGSVETEILGCDL